MLPLPESMQVTLDCVPPLTWDATCTVRSSSGVSVAANVASFPSPHVELALTLTSWAVVSSMLYPVGACSLGERSTCRTPGGRRRSRRSRWSSKGLPKCGYGPTRSRSSHQRAPLPPL